MSLTYNHRFECGGSIIDTFLIITAAHCVLGKTPKFFRVTAGEHNRTGFLTDPDYLDTRGNGTRQTRIPKYIYTHEAYNEASLENDVALMVLNEPFVFGSSIDKIELPEQDQQFQGFLTASGWGATEERGPVTAILQKARLPIVRIERCSMEYTKIGRVITNNMICAGQAGLDACEGDSGGPGFCEQDGARILCGVVSKGFGCGRMGYPGIFTRVANYIDWIDSIQEKIQ